MSIKSQVSDKKYAEIARHYETCFEKHGDTVQGVDWPNAEDANIRYGVMLDIIRFDPRSRKRTDNEPITILDFGCGTSLLYEYICEYMSGQIQYSGLDYSKKFIEHSRHKYPQNKYYRMDVLEGTESLPVNDYVIINGVFTEKRDLSFDEMYRFFKAVILRLIPYAKKGMAFNVMSKQVDWERNDLFHLPFDKLAEFLTQEIGRDFIFRNDYQLYEYTTYIYTNIK